MSPEEENALHQQLIKLGDMMGDGLHYERDGQWIAREYKATLRALGLLKAPKRKHNPAKTHAVDERMAQRVKDVACTQCAGKLKQVRSGTLKARCSRCNTKFTLLKTIK